MKGKPKSDPKSGDIRAYFDTLHAAWGPQHWWPAESELEVIVGAILTQNTAWTNVEKALANLRNEDALSVKRIREVSLENLERMIRPAGFFRQKASRLKSFVAWLDERYDGSLVRMFSTPTERLRQELLALNGIGPETADSILLYAGQHEIFVVDAYTRRIFERHRLVRADAKYDDVRTMVENRLQAPRHFIQPGVTTTRSFSVEPGPGPVEEVLTPVVHTPTKLSEAERSELARRYNEFHALLVQVAKHYCQSRVARCAECPLRIFLESGKPFLKSKGKRVKTEH